MGEFDPNHGEAKVIVSLAEAAMHMYSAAIDSLPFPEDKKFQKRAEVVLSGLRKLRAALSEAAVQSRTTSAVVVALGDVRRRYDDLMERAASAPGSTLGQQLYTTRVRAKLSAQEAANGVGLRPELPDELEAGVIPTEDEVVKVHQLVAALREVAGYDNAEQPIAAHLNVWDDAPAMKGAGEDAVPELVEPPAE
jgi:hypothetical protein